MVGWIYDRTFHNNETTRTVRIYGFKGRKRHPISGVLIPIGIVPAAYY